MSILHKLQEKLQFSPYKRGEEGGKGKEKLDAIDQGLTKEIDIQIPINK